MGKKGTIFISGICGISLYGMGIYCKKKGFNVIGSDSGSDEATLKILSKYNIEVFSEHKKENLRDADIFVYTAALKEDNPEYIEAKRRKIPVYTRTEFLNLLLCDKNNRIGVAGTHGKSTVSSMISEVFLDLGLNPTCFIGANFKKTGESFIAGGNEYGIFEACEYKRSFLSLNPTVCCVLNIEKDHTDCYADEEEAYKSYEKFVKKAEKAVLNYDDERVKRLKNASTKAVFYSIKDKNADVFAENIVCNKGKYSFTVNAGKYGKGTVNLSVFGMHNVQNALACISTCLCFGLKLGKIINSLEKYSGIERRFEKIGTVNGCDIYDDYAHHPTEIKSVLSFAKKMGYDKIICGFQPHTYKRTADLFSEFAGSFENCDKVIITDIFDARKENERFGVTSKLLTDNISNGIYAENFEIAEKLLKEEMEKKTLILTLGAGKMNLIAKKLAVNKN